VNALVAGGLLPPSRRGQTEAGFIGIEDWYRTFLGLAGVDPTDERAAAAGLPPTEGFDVWPLLSGATGASPRTEIWIGSSGDGNGDGPTPDHTPRGRGYDQSLTYLDGANDYWTSTTTGWCGAGLYTDLWASSGPAYGLNSSWACSQAHQPASCRYEEDVFANFTLGALRAHDPAVPLFMYYAPHSVHAPLEVPAAQLAKFAFIKDAPRQKYAAMVNYVDAHVGAIVAELKARGMWSNTLLVLSADNGGPIYGPASTCVKCDGSAGANNFPLRGGKVRVPVGWRAAACVPSVPHSF
jgi:arylsulfatase A-like enzyme